MRRGARTFPAVPVLRAFDEAATRAFWIDWLGFSLDWEHRFDPGLPLYMQVARDGCAVHLSQHHGDATPGSAIRIETDDIEALLAELEARPVPHAHPAIADEQWGREIRLADPSGNRVIFWQRPA